MYLRDYLAAITYLSTILIDDLTYCGVSFDPYKKNFHFKIDYEGNDYVVWRGGLVERVCPDTWSNPEHKKIIKHGNGKEIW